MAALGLIFSLVAAAMMFMAFVIDQSRELGREHIDQSALAMAVVAVGLITIALMFGPIGKALARMLEGEGGDDAFLQQRVEELEAQVDSMRDRAGSTGAINSTGYQLADVQERIDFLERLMAQQQQPNAQRLRGGE